MTFRWSARARITALGTLLRLTVYGLSLSADLGTDEHRQRYLEPLRRNLVVFAIERLAVATT